MKTMNGITSKKKLKILARNTARERNEKSKLLSSGSLIVGERKRKPIISSGNNSKES